MADDCVFCKIAKGEIPASKVYEDKNYLVFLDIMPANKGHLLVIPKKHYLSLEEMPEKAATGLILIEQKAIKAMVKTLNPDGYNCLQNNHFAAGQLIPHAHVHIIPRYNSDRFKLDWPHISYDSGELDEFTRKIKKGW
ncbi:HIT family protein [Candidatus Woesearchaeota archaeon]|nr:HIT family protein [Candidatus Woesearchaeota archaeon]